MGAEPPQSLRTDTSQNADSSKAVVPLDYRAHSNDRFRFLKLPGWAYAATVFSISASVGILLDNHDNWLGGFLILPIMFSGAWYIFERAAMSATSDRTRWVKLVCGILAEGFAVSLVTGDVSRLDSAGHMDGLQQKRLEIFDQWDSRLRWSSSRSLISRICGANSA